MWKAIQISGASGQPHGERELWSYEVPESSTDYDWCFDWAENAYFLAYWTSPWYIHLTELTGQHEHGNKC